jgi:hypothetical protein
VDLVVSRGGCPKGKERGQNEGFFNRKEGDFNRRIHKIRGRGGEKGDLYNRRERIEHKEIVLFCSGMVVKKKPVVVA